MYNLHNRVVLNFMLCKFMAGSEFIQCNEKIIMDNFECHKLPFMP